MRYGRRRDPPAEAIACRGAFGHAAGGGARDERHARRDTGIEISSAIEMLLDLAFRRLYLRPNFRRRAAT
jgi:hypothetical protein